MPPSGSTRASPRPIERVRAGALHRRREGIVAAGVEDDEPHALGALDRGDDPLERDGLELHVPVGLQMGVDGHEIVVVVHLHAVTGIVDHRPVGAVGVARERPQRIVEAGAREVLDDGHLGEADRLKARREPRGIALGVGQLRDLLVGAVADDEGDALAEHDLA